MTNDKDKKFVDDYKMFYEMFFNCMADSIDYLAGIQEKYKEQYEKVLEFNNDPRILDGMLEKLPSDKQLILLRVLLKAGEFGRKFVNLMELDPKEKRIFAKDLVNFAETLKKM